MHRIDGPGATVDKKFTEGDPVGGVAATVVTAAFMNDLQENIMAVLTAAGLTPTKGRAEDLVDALRTNSTGRLIGVRTFTANGTYTPTPGTTSIVVEAIGGGGGGGGSANPPASNQSSAGGGGGGAYTVGRFTSAFSGLAVTVGAAGAGGTTNSGNGGNGGTTSLGAIISAGGGVGALGFTYTGAATSLLSPGGNGGNLGTGGNIYSTGGASGGYGFMLPNSLIGGSGAACGKNGAAVPSAGSNSPGLTATAKGGGGGGGCSIAGNTFVGGAGAPGVLIIYEYA